MSRIDPITPAQGSEDPSAWSVAFLVSGFPVISETFVTTLAEGLIPHLAALRILSTADMPEPPPHHSAVARAGLLDRLATSPRDTRIQWRQLRALARAAPEKRLRLMALGALDLVAPRDRLAVTRMMAGQPAFDITHCQFGYEGLVALRHRRFGTLRSRALVCHLRGHDITGFVRERGEDVYADLFAEAELLVANCAFFRQRAIALGAPPDRTLVIGSPIDTAFFSPPEIPRPSTAGRPLRIVAVGRLVEKKGFEDAVAAMAKLGGLDARLDIYGDGPLRGRLESAIAASGLTPRVTLHGKATSDVILGALHAADIALAPSVTAPGGDSDAPVNTLKEAMATGLPVIATRHGGIPELVRDGETGHLVPERDPDAIAAAIRRLAERPETWPALGAAGRARVVEQFSPDRVVARTLDAYRQALAKETA